MPRTLSCHNRSSSEEWHDLRLDDEPIGTVFKGALRDFALVALNDGRRMWFGARSRKGPLDLVVDPDPDAAPNLSEVPDDASCWYERDPAALDAALLLGRAHRTAWLRQHWDVTCRAITWTVRPSKGMAGRAFRAHIQDRDVAAAAPIAEGKLRFVVQGWSVVSHDDETDPDALLTFGLLYHKILDDRRAPGLV